MPRTRFALVTALVIALAALLPRVGMAGPPPPNPNWTNSPTTGPSPNLTHVVDSTDGGECQIAARGFGGGVVIGQPLTVFAQVLLYDTDGVTVLDSQTYSPDGDGDWAGVFEIPSGLDPGVYPLKANCRGGQNGLESAGIGGPPVALGGLPVLFTYTDRSYTVPDESEPAGAVEAEASFTG
jgi:hypothetical protein